MRHHPTTLEEFWSSIPDRRGAAVRRLFDEISSNIDPAHELIGKLAGRISMEEFITRYEANDPRVRR